MAVKVIVLMGLYVLNVAVKTLEGIFWFSTLILNSQMHFWTRSYFI